MAMTASTGTSGSGLAGEAAVVEAGRGGGVPSGGDERWVGGGGREGIGTPIQDDGREWGRVGGFHAERRGWPPRGGGGSGVVAPATVPCGEGEAELGGVIPPDPDRGRERRWGEEGIGFRGWGSPCGGWMDKGGPAGPWGGWAGLLGRSPVGGGLLSCSSLFFLFPVLFLFLLFILFYCFNSTYGI